MEMENEELLEEKPLERQQKSPWKTIFALFLGVVIGAVGICFLVQVFCRATGSYLVIGKTSAQKTTDSWIDEAVMSKAAELNSYIEAYYMDEYDKTDIQNSMIKGLVEGLGDRYSVYYTAEEYEDLQVTTTGSYYGIGAGLSQDKDTMVVTVIKVYEGTPSEEAGLKKDDIILKVDDVDATSMELSSLVQKIRGEEGSSVHLEVYRSLTKETLEFDVERRNVVLPSVTGELLEDGVGYFAISEWQTNTVEQFKQILAELEEQGMQSMIVDVRGNTGGLLASVVDVLDVILPEGTVVYTENKYGKQTVYTSDASCLSYPMVVLIDGNSASASEIFAGAIKDYEYGTLIGTKTFGKGIVQGVFPLSDKDALKITTAKYFTPNGNYIHGKGIEPDLEIKYEYSGPIEEAYDMQYDNQLQKAIEVLHDKET